MANVDLDLLIDEILALPMYRSYSVQRYKNSEIRSESNYPDAVKTEDVLEIISGLKNNAQKS